MKKYLSLEGKNTKLKMIIRLLVYMIMHPVRAYELFFKIKKGNVGFGDHHLDIFFLRYGKLTFKKEENPTVSIIIPVYNQLYYTYRCLTSIIKNTTDVSYEVIVADDVSGDGTMYLDSYSENIVIKRNKNNLRFLLNCNEASKIARGKYLLFLNNDTEVTENWLSSLVNLIESDDSIGMVGSKLIFPDGKLQEAGGIIFSDGTGANYGKFDDASKPQYNYVRDVDYISGASIMLSRKVWDKVGMFSEEFAPAYCEDSDLAFKIRSIGLRVVYQPQSVVIHYEGASNGSDVSDATSLKHYQIVNCEKLKTKWEQELKSQPSSNTDKNNITYRDRINGKKVILFIDHYVPEFDKDAGSKTTFQYIQMFIEKGYVVKFLGDNFYNREPYTGILQQMGVEVLFGIDYRNTIEDWIFENRYNIDVVYMNRPHISIKYIDFFKANTNIKIIYYGHDLHFLREQREYEITKDESHLKDSEHWKKIELDLMRKSDVVYYPSYIEKNLINSIDKSINVKAINAYVFDKVDIKDNYHFDDREGIMFVGGFTHRPNADAVLWFANNIYPMIYKKIKMPFYIVGSNVPEQIKALENVPGIIVKGYVSEEELNDLYNKCKLSVIPLRYGAGIKGKVVEAMSKGVPFVTTSCGAEGIVGIEKIVPVVDDPKEFANAVVDLYTHNDKLEKLSLDERKYIDKKFSTNAAYDIIKEDFTRQNEFVVLTPDGFGGKGDEAMIGGALAILAGKKVKLVTQRKELWSNKVSFNYSNYEEVYYKLDDFKKSIGSSKKMVIIGADLIDGTQGVESSLCRLEAAKEITDNGGYCYIFCSFRSDVDHQILKYIKSLNDHVYFYLRDEVSYRNFINQARRECKYFPDLAFFYYNDIKCKDNYVIDTIDKIKKEYNLIGVNFSETSFRSFYDDYSIENKKMYVKNALEKILDTIEKPFLVFLSHDTRKWDGYNCDEDYADIAIDLLKEKKYNDYIKVDSNITHFKLLYIIKHLDTLVSGRMHLSIGGFKSNVIPIVYTGKGSCEFSMNDKMHGMFMDRIGDDSFVTHDLDSLGNALDKVMNNHYDCLDLLERLNETKEKDLTQLENLKKEILKEDEIERGLIIF